MKNTPDSRLLRACEEFFTLNKRWVEANPEYNLSGDMNLDYEGLLQLTRSRDQVLKNLVPLSAATKQGLLVKQEVLEELLILEETESPRIIPLVFAILEDYRMFVRGGAIHQSVHIDPLIEQEDGGDSLGEKRPRRFRLHNIFGFFHN